MSFVSYFCRRGPLHPAWGGGAGGAHRPPPPHRAAETHPTTKRPTTTRNPRAEAIRSRSPLIYTLAGAALMAAGYYSAGFGWSYEESIDRAPPPISRAAEIAVAVGAVFGLTYWAIAGRRAGVWLR